MSNGGRFEVNGSAVKSLRVSKAWTHQDLSERAGCSVGTIRNAEKGAALVLTTVNLIATSLGVEPAEILKDPLPVAAPKPKERTWEITIKVSTPFEQFDETTDLPALMKALIDRLSGGELGPQRIVKGSTQLVFRVNEATLMKLMEAYASDQLDDLDVIELGIPDYLTPPEFPRESSATHNNAPTDFSMLQVKVWLKNAANKNKPAE